MTARGYVELDRELEQYLRLLLQGMGRTERLQALGLYATGLLLSGERKSIAPMAARLSASAAEADAMRQRLQQAVVVAKWEPRVLFARLAHHLNQELGDIEALIGDDTGIPRYGDHCVGTARQYSGTLGRVDRCQVIPSLHAAGPRGSFCVGARLYLPDKWTESPERMREAGVPDGVTFATKWELMLGLIDQATQNDEGNPHLGWDSLPFVGDAGYGDVSELRRELNVRGRPYILEVMLTTSVWSPGTEPELREGLRGKRGPARTVYRDGAHSPVSVAELVLSQTRDALTDITWCNGDGPQRRGQFGAVRVQPACGHKKGMPPEPEQWLLWEWPHGAELPSHYWLSTLPADTPIERLVYLAKLRWRVERDYQEMKAEVGLDHFEGRTWNGLHHHLALCAVAHGFLVLSKARWQRKQTKNTAPRPRTPVKKTAHTEESVRTETH